MLLDIPVTFCVVKSEPITPQGHYAYRRLIAVKCLWSELDRLYAEYQSMYYGNIGCTTMVFTREPDETPVEAMSLYPLELGKMIGDMSKDIESLKSLVEVERKWKDQLAEDNRILREKLNIPDSHFKYAKSEEGSLTAKDVDKWMDDNFSKEAQVEYKDW